MKVKYVEDELYEAMKKVKTKDMLNPIIEEINSKFRLNLFLSEKYEVSTLNFGDVHRLNVENAIKHLVQRLAEVEADKYLAIMQGLTSEKIEEKLKKDENKKN